MSPAATSRPRGSVENDSVKSFCRPRSTISMPGYAAASSLSNGAIARMINSGFSPDDCLTSAFTVITRFPSSLRNEAYDCASWMRATSDRGSGEKRK